MKKLIVNAMVALATVATVEVAMGQGLWVVGTSGLANYATLEAALAAPMLLDGDIIRIEPGTYTLASELTIARVVSIQGATGDPEDVIFQRDPSVQNPDFRLFRMSANATLSGLTIQNANMTTTTDKDSYDFAGAGIYMSAGTMTNCIVRNCYAGLTTRQAGGVYANGGLIVDCVISNNTLDSYHCYGAGVVLQGTAQLLDSLVCDNIMKAGGDTAGAGVFSGNASVLIERCRIVGNRAQTGAGFGGAGIYMTAGTLRNSLIANNVGYSIGGGGMFLRGGLVENCTFARNTLLNAGQAGSGMMVENGTVRGCIVSENSGGLNELYKWGGTFTYSLVSQLMTAPQDAGNVQGDPMFLSGATGDFRLRPLSPCIGTVGEAISSAYDLDGNARTQFNPGLDEYPSMGCYEYMESANGKLMCNFFADTTHPSDGVVTFTPHLNGDVAGLMCIWTFGDGATWTTNEAVAVTHTYSGNDTFDVSLTVSNTAGDSDVLMRVAYIVTLLDTDVFVGPDGLSISPYSSPETAATNLQDAVNVMATMIRGGATANTVWVLPGTNVLLSSIAIDETMNIRGTSGNPEDCIIDGDGTYNITLVFAATGAVIEDVTIRHGFSAGSGGGVRILAPNARVSNCIIEDCQIAVPGGVNGYGGGVAIEVAGAVVEGCIIRNNSSNGGQSNESGGGGGFYISAWTIANCIVTNNAGWKRIAGGFYATGGTITNCTIAYNLIQAHHAYSGGGYAANSTLIVDSRIVSNRLHSTGPCDACGAGLRVDNNVVVERCEIIGNRTTSGGSFGGAGIAMYGSAAVRNSLIAYNEMQVNVPGAGVWMQGGTLEYCTVTENQHLNGAAAGSGVSITSGTIQGCIIFGNTGGASELAWSGGVINNSVTIPLISSASCIGNTDLNPLFIAPQDANFHVRPGSPCIGTAPLYRMESFDLDGVERATDPTDMGCFLFVVQPDMFLASFTADTVNALPGGTITFTPSVSGDTAGLSLLWNFGDGNSTQTYNLSPVPHTYAAVGPYTVSVTASNTAGDTDTCTRDQYVFIIPDMDVFAGPNGSSTFPYNSAGTAAKNLADAVSAMERIRAIGGTHRTVWVLPGVNVMQGTVLINQEMDVRGTTTAEECVIDGANTYNITTASAISGVEIRDITVQYGKASNANGGGISLQSSNSTVANCILQNCVAEYRGGGLSMTAAGCVASNCVIRFNTSKGKMLAEGWAGGIYMTDGLVVDCRVLTNAATGHHALGGGIFMQGGVVDRAVIEGNTVAGNVDNGDTAGLGVCVRGGAIRNCLVVGNVDLQGAGGIQGGALRVDGGNPTVENCTIVKNTAHRGQGGGLWANTGTLRNLIVADNVSLTAPAEDQDVYRPLASPSNQPIPMSYSYVKATPPPAPGDVALWTGLDFSAPGFKNATAGNYRLDVKSPCSRKGLVVENSWMQTGLDLDRLPRLFQDKIDMGAYQTQLSEATAIMIR